MKQIYDVVGIGFGPANIAAAIALEENGTHNNFLFLEKAAKPVWQEEMLFDISLDTFSNIQNIPYRDLVTPRNPRSRYTFMNYLFESGLMFEHLNMDMLMPLRPDYAKYIAWVAKHFESRIKVNQTIVSITSHDEGGQHLYCITNAQGEDIFSKHLLVGTGRLPHVPEAFKNIKSPRVFHQTRYNSASSIFEQFPPKKIAVIGSSQSAVEIIMHLSKTQPEAEIHSVLRRFAYPLKDTSPFMSEIFFPEFTDLYFAANPSLKTRIDRDVVRTNYGACDMDVLEELYRQIYYDRLHNKNLIHVRRLVDVVSATASDESVKLTLVDNLANQQIEEEFDAVILATGFSNIGTGAQDVRILPLLAGIEHILDVEDQGCVQVDRNYCVKMKDDIANNIGALIMNGLCESTHGMGDGGSLSLVSIRAEKILAALDQHEQKLRANHLAQSAADKALEAV